MSDDDFFKPSQSDKTVILPTPGGRGQPNAPQMPKPGANIHSQAGSIKPPSLSYLKSAEKNPILGNCQTIMTYAAQLRTLSVAPDVDQLFNELVMQIKTICENLRQSGQDDEVIVTCRYMLCSFIDEMIVNTPWGATSRWTTHSLLSFFQKEAQGGAKFFDILNKVEQQSARYIDLIELGYVCLSLGYLGKYRMQADGASHLSSYQENLYHQIRQVRQHQDLPLSKVTEGVNTEKSPLTQGKALLLTAAASVAILLLVYTSLLFDINSHSDPVAIKASALGLNMPQLIKKQRADDTVLAETGSWMDLLAKDMSEGRIDIQKSHEGIKFILFGDGLFDSGSAQLVNSTLIQRIIKALEQTSGNLLIVGHSDNIPIRTLAFPSNLDLSKKRAESVADLVQQSMPNRSITIEGRADLQPLVENNTKENRAKNRRVEITVLN